MPNRVEREIEDILARLDDLPSPQAGRDQRRPPRPSRWSMLKGRLPRSFGRFTGGHVVLGAAVGLLLAMLLRGILPSVAQALTWVSLAIIAAAIVLSIARSGGGRRRSKTTYWRGQPVELHRHGPMMRVRMWWRRRNRS